MVRDAPRRVNRAVDTLHAVIGPPRNRVSIVKAAGVDARALAAECASDAWVAGASVLKRDERSSVLAGESSAGPLVVKSLLLDRPKDWLSRVFGTTRLMRQWRGAEILSRHGFLVARPLAIWRGRREDGRVVESLAMERLPGCTVLRHLANRYLSPEYEAAVARKIGEDIARLACLGLVNRDHKPSNLLIVQPNHLARTAPSIAILDTVGIRSSRQWPALVDMLFALVVEPAGCRVVIPPGLRLTTLRAVVRIAELRNIDCAWLWLDVREQFTIHGDPTPKVNPLVNGQSKTNAGTSPS